VWHQSALALQFQVALPASPWVEFASGEEAPIWGARLLTGTPPTAPQPDLEMHLSTTRGTNALLEGDPGAVGLVVNQGLEGLLAIGTQQRLGIFDLAPRKPPLLAATTVGIACRLAADGTPLQGVDMANVEACIKQLKTAGVRHVAVALMHSWRNSAHEETVAAALRHAGFESVCTSSELAAVPRLLPRAQTAAVEATLHAPVRQYLAAVAGALRGSRESLLLVSTSAGGLVPAAVFRAKDSLLSGPAAGCAGAVTAMRRAGIARAVTLDIGGTSTDVARLDEHGVGLRFESSVAGVTVATPSVNVHSVAAGGGSVCVASPHGLFVGPQSAGSVPGPACYGRGGPLTLTDVNLLLGRLWPEGSSLPLSVEASMKAAHLECQRSGRELHAMLNGFLEIAHEHTSSAVRTVSTAAGHDPRDHALLAFGGAGGQHACAVAQRLSMNRVVVAADAGFLSALGALNAAREHMVEETLLAPLGDGQTLLKCLLRLRNSAAAHLQDQGAESTCTVRAVAVLRAKRRTGTMTVDVDWQAGAPSVVAHLRQEFTRRMQALGDAAANQEPEVDSVRVIQSAGGASHPSSARGADTSAGSSAAADQGAPDDFHAPNAWVVPPLGGDRTPVWLVSSLAPGQVVHGPALLADDGSTVVVDGGWQATPLPTGGVDLTPQVRAGLAPTLTGRDDRVDIEVAAARFVGIATWMGTCLERAAVSVNVKERLDFSCGILDPHARLVANAPHIPVHLGALGMCVRSMLQCIRIGPGDIALTNDPRHGGSHLPDLTVVRAVHARSGAPLGYVAARAHHAEVGGIVPGSMPTQATTLSEEGVLIPPMIIGTDGVLDEPAVVAALSSTPFPSRDPASNLADIRAAVSALNAGADALCHLAEERGIPTLLMAMDRLLERSAQHVRDLARAMAPLGLRRAVGRLDDGHGIGVEILGHADGTMDIHVDAPGIHPRCFNAPESVSRSAILYVLRVLAAKNAQPPLDDHVAPLNEGFLLPVRVRVSPGFLNAFTNAAHEGDLPPVFAGNTESSQRLVDTLLLACNAAACSQGTMNNLVFGNDQFSVYETIGGGAGACLGHPGADSVHVHMSNTRLTDPETLELRHPVRLERLQVRAGSGGAGTWPGGCGTVRRIRMLEPVQLSFIGQHRIESPAGLHGGGAGARGTQVIIHADGREEPMPGSFSCALAAGDAVEISTPGGGGWGAI
jgi:5-oxoprolinase (ATP-hydrolysing)